MRLHISNLPPTELIGYVPSRKHTARHFLASLRVFTSISLVDPPYPDLDQQPVSSADVFHPPGVADTAVAPCPYWRIYFSSCKSGLRNPYLSADFPDTGASYSLFQRKHISIANITRHFYAMILTVK